MNRSMKSFNYRMDLGLKLRRDGLTESLAPASELPPRPFMAADGFTAATVARDAMSFDYYFFCCV